MNIALHIAKGVETASIQACGDGLPGRLACASTEGLRCFTPFPFGVRSKKAMCRVAELERGNPGCASRLLQWPFGSATNLGKNGGPRHWLKIRGAQRFSGYSAGVDRSPWIALHQTRAPRSERSVLGRWQAKARSPGCAWLTRRSAYRLVSLPFRVSGPGSSGAISPAAFRVQQALSQRRQSKILGAPFPSAQTSPSPGLGNTTLG